MKKNIAVLFGGKSSEYEISLSSAHALLSNIDEKKYNLYKIAITKDGKWYLFEGDDELIRQNTYQTSDKIAPILFSPDNGSRTIFVNRSDRLEKIVIDAAFPALHGRFGEDGQVQGMLSVMGVPTVGCGCASSAISMDKAITKSIIKETGIRQAKAVIIRLGDDIDGAAAKAEELLGYPMFVKPACSGSSVGVSKAKTRSELLRAINTAFKEDSKILIEEAVCGVEAEVAVLEENGKYTVSVPAEIDKGSSEFYDYETKYFSDASSFYIPARIPDEKIAEIRICAEKIFRSLDCRGLARVDFFYTPDGKLVFNEINTLPGFTPISMYPKLMINEGVEYGELIDRLIDAAI